MVDFLVAQVQQTSIWLVLSNCQGFPSLKLIDPAKVEKVHLCWGIVATDHTIIQVYQGDRDLCTNLLGGLLSEHLSFGVHKHEKTPLRSCRRKRNIGQKMMNVSGSLSSRGKRRYGTEDTVDRRVWSTRVKSAEFLWPCSTATLSFFCLVLLRSFYKASKSLEMSNAVLQCAVVKTRVKGRLNRRVLYRETRRKRVVACEVREYRAV